MNKICLHGILSMDEYNSFLSRKRLIEVIKSGYIYSKENLNSNVDRRVYNGWNSYDYISLCALGKILELDQNSEEFIGSAFNTYISHSISFAFDASDLKILDTTYIPMDAYKKMSKEELYKLSTQIQRYSTMKDEVQVKDKISLESAKAVNIPFDYLQKSLGYEEALIELDKIRTILKNNFINVPLYDISKRRVLK